MPVKWLALWIIAFGFVVFETEACVLENQDKFINCSQQFDTIEKSDTFWEDICSNQGLTILDCLLETTAQCPELWTATNLGNLAYQKNLVQSITPATDSYSVKCERNTLPECDVAYECFSSVFMQPGQSASHTGLSEFYLWFCGPNYGVTHILECFTPVEEVCPATLDHLRNLKVIQYTNGDSLTFEQLSEKTATECNGMGVLVTQCQDTGECVVVLDGTAEAVTGCLNDNTSQCLTEPTVDFGQNILQCDYTDVTSACIEDGCGPQAAGFFIRMFEYLKCGIRTNAGCSAVSISLWVGQEGYETMTTVNFPATLPGRMAVENCPTEYEGVISRTCSLDGQWQPVTDSCVKDILKDIRESIDNLKMADEVDPVQFQSVLDDLSEVTKPGRNKTDKPPINEVKDVINEVTDIYEKKTETTEREFESFFDIVSNTIDKSNTEEWNKKAKTGGGSIMRNVERIIDKRLKSQECNYTENRKGNLDVTVGASVEDIRCSPDPEAGEIVVSREALRKQGLSGAVCYGGVTYGTIAPILSQKLVVDGETKELESNKMVNTDVISLQLAQTLRNLDPPAVLTFSLIQRDFTDPVCVFWDFSAPTTEGNGAWNTDGCEFERFSDSGRKVICKCSHLTNFAVLMSLSGTSEDHIKALSIISAVGCAISIVALLLTIIFHIVVWRFVRSDRSTILMNLCVALLIALIAFLAGINRTESSVACKAIATILHFLFLAVFFLMLTQGIEIMICVVHVFTTKFRLKLCLPFAWLIPGIIVGISLGVTKTEGYGNSKFCWLSVKSGLIWAFIGPAVVVIFINIIVIIVVFKKLMSSHTMRDKAAKEKAKTSLRSICVLLPLLGCTWAFGILSINNDTVVFQYIFCILNSLQGLFIFLFHCVLNNQLREALRKRDAKRRSLATFESDLKKRSRSDSVGQDMSPSVAEKDSDDRKSQSSSNKLSKLHRHYAKTKEQSGQNGLDEWHKEQRKMYHRDVRRQISDKLDWTQ